MTTPPTQPVPELLRTVLAGRGLDPATLRVADLRAPVRLPFGRLDALVCGPDGGDPEEFRRVLNRVVAGGWVALSTAAGRVDGHHGMIADLLAQGWLRVRVQQHVPGGTSIVARKVVDVPHLRRPSVSHGGRSGRSRPGQPGAIPVLRMC